VRRLGLSVASHWSCKDLEDLALQCPAASGFHDAGDLRPGLTRKRARPFAAVSSTCRSRSRDVDPETAERIAGVSSVKQKQAAIALVKELGFAFSVNVVLHRANLDRIGEIIDLAAGYGADRLELANTQYYGWGLHNRASLMPSRDQVLRAKDIAQDRIQRYKGTMQITFVLRLLEGCPRPLLLRRMGRYASSWRRTAARSCHGAYAIPSLELLNVRQHSSTGSGASPRHSGLCGTWMRALPQLSPYVVDFGGRAGRSR
jgi:hypothetical protein